MFDTKSEKVTREIEQLVLKLEGLETRQQGTSPRDVHCLSICRVKCTRIYQPKKLVLAEVANCANWVKTSPRFLSAFLRATRWSAMYG